MLWPHHLGQIVGIRMGDEGGGLVLVSQCLVAVQLGLWLVGGWCSAVGAAGVFQGFQLTRH